MESRDTGQDRGIFFCVRLKLNVAYSLCQMLEHLTRLVMDTQFEKTNAIENLILIV